MYQIGFKRAVLLCIRRKWKFLLIASLIALAVSLALKDYTFFVVLWIGFLMGIVYGSYDASRRWYCPKCDRLALKTDTHCQRCEDKIPTQDLK